RRTQVARADLATGRVTPLTGTDLSITDFAVTPGGDLLALVVTVGKGLYRIYVVPVGSGAPVPLPTTGAELMVTPTFLPLAADARLGDPRHRRFRPARADRRSPARPARHAPGPARCAGRH